MIEVNTLSQLWRCIYPYFGTSSSIWIEKSCHLVLDISLILTSYLLHWLRVFHVILILVSINWRVHKLLRSELSAMVRYLEVFRWVEVWYHLIADVAASTLVWVILLTTITVSIGWRCFNITLIVKWLTFMIHILLSLILKNILWLIWTTSWRIERVFIFITVTTFLSKHLGMLI